tara:strand:- start:56 stop:247 length:192 start_codon:yes stop_codon:yes gene_type:complete
MTAYLISIGELVLGPVYMDDSWEFQESMKMDTPYCEDEKNFNGIMNLYCAPQWLKYANLIVYW